MNKIIHKEYKLFPIGIGTWGIGGYVKKDPEIDFLKQREAIAYMLNHGMNLIELNLWYAEGAAVEISTNAIKDSGIKRERLFIYQSHYSHEKKPLEIKKSIYELLEILKTDYIDSICLDLAFFIKFPFEEVIESVHEILEEKIAKYFSVTNENLTLLKKLNTEFGNKLFAHEVGFNFEVRENEKYGQTQYADKNEILTIVNQPLRRNRTALRNWPLLSKLAKKYNVTQNQIIMNWIVSKGFLPMTKSETISHIDEHLNALELEIEKNELQKINEFYPPGYKHPKIDWDLNGEGIRVDQLSNQFDEEYDKQTHEATRSM